MLPEYTERTDNIATNSISIGGKLVILAEMGGKLVNCRKVKRNSPIGFGKWTLGLRKLLKFKKTLRIT
jgi:hypothetical protein